MFSVNTKDVRRLEDDLKRFKERAYPFATKSTVNGAAFKARSIAITRVQDDLVLRNKFTTRSIQVDMARTLNISQQQAIVGSTVDYMEDQEFGAIKSGNGKGTPIATGYSAGQANAVPRTRLPTKQNKLENINLRSRGKGKGRKQKNLIAVKSAATSGKKYVYLDLGRRKGIFRVLGGKRKPYVKMVWDLSNKSIVIPKNPWLYPSVQEAAKFIPEIYKKALIFQLKRNMISW